MKKRRMRLAALLMAAMMLCGLAVAEPVHEHQWSAWRKVRIIRVRKPALP